MLGFALEYSYIVSKQVSHLFSIGLIIDAYCRFTLGAEGVLPGRYIESLLRVFKQFTHT